MKRIIIEALKVVNYSSLEDNKRFLSAVQDLAIDYPEERKFLQRNADDRFLKICSEALCGDPSQISTISQQASNYVQQEYRIAEAWADQISETIIQAFAVYGGRVSVTPVPEPQPVVRPKKPKPKEGRHRGIKGLLIGILCLTILALAVAFVFAWKSYSPHSGNDDIPTGGALDYADLNEYTEPSGEPVDYWGDDSMYVSIPELRLPEIGDGKKISLSYDTSNYDSEHDSFWYFGFDYDDSIIEVDSTTLDFIDIGADFESADIIITRVGKGKTKLKIYAVDNETGKEIDSIAPAYVTVY